MLRYGYLTGAAIAALISWLTLRDAAALFLGLPPWLAALYPAVIDGPMLTLSAVVWTARRRGERVPATTWLLLAGYVALSSAVNVAAHVGWDTVRDRWGLLVTIAMSALPPISAYLGFERAAAGAAARRQVAADTTATAEVVSADTPRAAVADSAPTSSERAPQRAARGRASRADTTRGQRRGGIPVPERLARAYTTQPPDTWTARSLAAAAGCGRTAAARYLAAVRATAADSTADPAGAAVADTPRARRTPPSPAAEVVSADTPRQVAADTPALAAVSLGRWTP